ncbi:MAG: hypothetical protein RL557_429 [archaeon]|jgi:large subunit ribosomal protein L24
MKQEFSLGWRASKQPRKQRKYRFNAPFFAKRKLLSANLSKELRKRYSRRSFPLRKGDNVIVRAGEFKGKSGTISSIDYKRIRVDIEGIFRTKKDGSKVPVHFFPSRLQVKELALDDKKRKEALERKNKPADKKEMKKENKTAPTEKKSDAGKTTFKKLPSGGKK